MVIRLGRAAMCLIDRFEAGRGGDRARERVSEIEMTEGVYKVCSSWCEQPQASAPRALLPRDIGVGSRGRGLSRVPADGEDIGGVLEERPNEG